MNSLSSSFRGHKLQDLFKDNIEETKHLWFFFIRGPKKLLSNIQKHRTCNSEKERQRVVQRKAPVSLKESELQRLQKH